MLRTSGGAKCRPLHAVDRHAGDGIKPRLALMDERVRQRRISQLGGGTRSNDWKASWIKQAQLNEHTRLIPQDGFEGDLVAFDTDDHDKYRFHASSSRLNSWQDVVHLDGVSERDDELIDETFLAVRARNRFEHDIRREELGFPQF